MKSRLGCLESPLLRYDFPRLLNVLLMATPVITRLPWSFGLVQEELGQLGEREENILGRGDGTCKGPMSGRGNGINDRVARVQSSR